MYLDILSGSYAYLDDLDNASQSFDVTKLDLWDNYVAPPQASVSASATTTLMGGLSQSASGDISASATTSLLARIKRSASASISATAAATMVGNATRGSYATITSTATATMLARLKASATCQTTASASTVAAARKLGELWVDQPCQTPELWRRYA